MLKRENRLLTKFEYNITRKHGTHHSGEYAHIFILKPRNYEGPAKIGFVVSNKFHKKATKRNKVKRQFREITRKNLEGFGDNIWIVVQPRFKSIDATYEKINSDFNKILQKISIPG